VVGLQWTDVLTKGNDIGFAVGQPVFATALTGGIVPNDGNTVWEWWYKIQVTDHIAITMPSFTSADPWGQPRQSGKTLANSAA
jgi:hypothetical protein